MSAKYYSAPEILEAYERFKRVTGRDSHAFLEWLGHRLPFKNDMARNFPTPVLVSTGMSAHTKMELLQSPHYHALLKAALIKEKVDE